MFPSFDKLTEAEFEKNCRILSEDSFPDVEAAVERLTRLREAAEPFESARETSKPRSVPPWFKTLKRILSEAPFPADVLDAMDRFVQKSPTAADAFSLFEQTPRSLDVLSRLACASSYLTDVLIAQPQALRELTTERRTAEMKSREGFLLEAQREVDAVESTREKLSVMRCYQRRQILRIGMCDAFGLLDLKFVTLQISLLADAMVQLCLNVACDECNVDSAPFGVIALGKHGGEELNYSSDIDLILIAERNTPISQRVARHLIDGLSEQMPSGFLYRVDMRLRPWGDAGPLVSTPDAYEQYLRDDAALWEKQALLKARVVAGDRQPGVLLIKRLPQLLYATAEEAVLSNVRRMKGQIEAQLKRAGKLHSEVKLGAGSIRDVEFLVQALQLIHGSREPRLASANTLDALVKLAEFSVIDVMTFRQLREGYIFLRTIEHALQLLHNQQTHELPSDQTQREWLARRLDYPNQKVLLTRFDEHRRAVRRIFEQHFSESTPAAQQSDVAKSATPKDQADSSQLEARFSSNSSLKQWFNNCWKELDSDLCLVESYPVENSRSQRLLTIAAVEVSGLTSLLCGVFFASQIDIREGESINGGGRSRCGFDVPEGRFAGTFLCDNAPTSTSIHPTVSAADLQTQLKDLMQRQKVAPNEVRKELLEMFCEGVSSLKPDVHPMSDLAIFVDHQSSGESTVLRIAADDSFGFFFELSNALTISGFRILRAELGQRDGRIRDTICVAETDGRAVTSASRVDELRTAITLIKQFTNWLPSYNEPHQALLRFRDLLKRLLQRDEGEAQVEVLRDPKVLQDIGQVLGMSRYLWEDFLQVRTVDLLPLLTNRDALSQRVSSETLSQELDSLLSTAESEEDSVRRLNSFKDRHLFRIDLRHVLGHCDEFGSFSREITELAEIVVQAACRAAIRRLSADYGLPKPGDGSSCPFTIAALGKFGGIEMGFASDIELFVVYAEDCRTDGHRELSAGSFFERMVAEASQMIRSRRKGIFEIDLRMRPYGQAGSPAVSLETFRQYFAPDGDAWPYERQSLVKMRCVAGDEPFGEEVNRICRAIIFSGHGFNFDAMRAMREKQVRQLVRGGTINAKLSSGALVDCEYAVQALQLTFGDERPSLRSSNTLQALDAALAEGLLTEDEHRAAKDAYMFLRELIDCLRMARGNAEDLTVPTPGTSEFRHLAKRMDTVHDSPLPLTSLESQLEIVRSFSERVEEICRER